MSELWERRWAKTEPLLAQAQTPDEADALTHSTAARSAAGYYSRVEATLSRCIGSPKAALDVGCGTGHWSEFLHNEHGIPYERITAVDIAQQPVDFVRDRCLGIDARTMNIARERPSGEYDLAVAIGVMHHMVTPEDLAGAFENVLSVTGRFVVFPVRTDEEQLKVADNAIKRFWRRADYLRAANAAGVAFEEIALAGRPRWLILNRTGI